MDRTTELDDLLAALLLPPDPVLDAALEAADAAGLPAIGVAPVQGRMLEVLARLRGATRILELGTLGGYSTIWLARGLASGGRLLSLEAEPAYAAVAERNVASAGLADRVEIRVGDAHDSLAALIAAGDGPFDLVFFDADKRSYPEYLEAALELSAPGTLLIADNVVRDGRIAAPAADDPNTAGARRFLELLGKAPNVVATAIQTVGAKGHDGFALGLVTGEPGL